MDIKAALMGSLLLMNTAFAQTPGLRTLLMPGPLVKAHEDLRSECSKCHSSFDKRAQVGLCFDCHEEVATDLDGHKGFHGRLTGGTNCTQCHTEHLGRVADIVGLNKESFEHELTDFPLLGRHQKTACSSCHKPGSKYREAKVNCYDCHEPDDRHRKQLGSSCDDCHSPGSWAKTTFEHDKTNFQLKGEHKNVPCAACHPGERYKDIAATCISCHALSDVHAGTYGEECDRCHTVTGWGSTSFDHDLDTDFKLLASHEKVPCQACHQPGRVEELPGTTCIDCHLGDDEHQGKNGRECANCHSERGWAKITFDHNHDTDFPLLGKHADVNCGACHKGPVYEEKLKSDCHSCHAMDDIHESLLGEQCERCHEAQGWADNIVFAHDLTAFPLIGMHASVACEACHIDRSFKETTHRCVECHETQDEHKGALGDQCHQCHNPKDWKLWRFNHNSQTDFVLENAHQRLSCSSCHTEPAEKFARLNSDCVFCHREDEMHDGDFGIDCDRCHTTDRFNNLQKLTLQ